MTAVRAAYRAHIVKVLTLAGVKDAEARAGRIFDLEVAIAKAHAPRAESEDVVKANNPWARTAFAKTPRAACAPSQLTVSTGAIAR